MIQNCLSVIKPANRQGLEKKTKEKPSFARRSFFLKFFQNTLKNVIHFDSTTFQMTSNEFKIPPQPHGTLRTLLVYRIAALAQSILFLVDQFKKN